MVIKTQFTVWRRSEEGHDDAYYALEMGGNDIVSGRLELRTKAASMIGFADLRPGTVVDVVVTVAEQ
jgi:hypothetical protein